VVDSGKVRGRGGPKCNWRKKGKKQRWEEQRKKTHSIPPDGLKGEMNSRSLGKKEKEKGAQKTNVAWLRDQKGEGKGP